MSDVYPDWLAHRAFVLPAKTAVADAHRTLTFAGLDARSRAIAAELAAAGVDPGERVALLAPNSLEFAAAVHGIARAHAVVVPLNLRLTAEEQAWQVGHCGARLVVAHETVAAAAKELGKRAGVNVLMASDDLGSSASEPANEASHRGSDTFAIIYTSGTTGRPKGAMLTYGNFWASAAASAFNIGVDPADRWLACMPLFHVGGLSILVRSAIYGTSVVVHPSFDEREVNRALREEAITLLSVVPTMLRRMLDADDQPYPATVRTVLVGGGPVDAELLERALARGLPVLQTYGLTESCAQVSTLSPADATTHTGSAGKPLVATRLCIDAPPGEAGEILVAGPTVTPGYLDDPAATAAAIRNGWLHTGDVGRLDEEGFLYVLDRRDDLIISGGENVYPAEVEAHLLQHPHVEAAAVVGLADAEWGQVPVAAVVARDGFDAVEIDGWLRGRLAHYKVPRRYVAVPSLPATASGKVQRHLVRELVAGSDAPR